MKILNFLSNSIIPIVITAIMICGIKENIKIFDTFLEGVKEGIEIIINIFPTLLGLFVAIGTLRNSGFIEFITKILSPVIKSLGFPQEIMPLVFLRPISRKCFDSNWNGFNENIWCR